MHRFLVSSTLDIRLSISFTLVNTRWGFGLLCLLLTLASFQYTYITILNCYIGYLWLYCCMNLQYLLSLFDKGRQLVPHLFFHFFLTQFPQLSRQTKIKIKIDNIYVSFCNLMKSVDCKSWTIITFVIQYNYVHIFHCRGKATVAKILFFPSAHSHHTLIRILRMSQWIHATNWSKWCFLLVFCLFVLEGDYSLIPSRYSWNLFKKIFLLSFCSNLGVLLHIFLGHDSVVHLSISTSKVSSCSLPPICSFIISVAH